MFNIPSRSISFYSILLFVVIFSMISPSSARSGQRKQVHIKIAHVDKHLDYEVVSSEDIEDELKKVLAGKTRVNGSHKEENNVQSIEIEKGSWHLFTKEGHPAHPSHYALIKTEKNGKIVSRSVRQTAGKEKYF